jgi:hypothetical protein
MTLSKINFFHPIELLITGRSLKFIFGLIYRFVQLFIIIIIPIIYYYKEPCSVSTSILNYPIDDTCSLTNIGSDFSSYFSQQYGSTLANSIKNMSLQFTTPGVSCSTLNVNLGRPVNCVDKIGVAITTVNYQDINKIPYGIIFAPTLDNSISSLSLQTIDFNCVTQSLSLSAGTNVDTSETDFLQSVVYPNSDSISWNAVSWIIGSSLSANCLSNTYLDATYKYTMGLNFNYSDANYVLLNSQVFAILDISPFTFNSSFLSTEFLFACSTSQCPTIQQSISFAGGFLSVSMFGMLFITEVLFKKLAYKDEQKTTLQENSGAISM